MATATPYYASGYSSMATKVITPLINARKSQDLIYESTPTWSITSQKGEMKRRKWGHDFTIALLMDKAKGIDSFSYYDEVSTAASKGAQAARFELAFYSAPMSMSLQEEAEYDSDDSLAPRLVEYLDQIEQGMAERFALDDYRGNSSRSTNILGWEQVFPAYAHLKPDGTGSPAITDRVIYKAQVRQSANSYGGIQRAAWTLSGGVETRGTGWEGNTFDGSCTNATPFALSSGAYNDAFKRFLELVSMSEHGTYQPNLMIGTSAPYNDIDFMFAGKQTFEKASGEFAGVQIGHSHMMVRSAILIKDDNARTHNANTGGIGDAVGAENIYGVPLKDLLCAVDSRFEFTPTRPRTPQAVHASTSYVLWRGQRVFKNPRLGFRYADYKTT